MRTLTFLTSILTVALMSLQVFAAPAQISAQGVLRNPEGGLLEGELELTFRIYAAQQDEQALWQETQTVTVKGGLFNTLLPGNQAVAPFPAALLADGGVRWLAIEPQGEAELPRTAVVSVVYALQANAALTSNGLTCMGCIGLDHLAATVLQAGNVAYDNALSGLASQTIQDALDESVGMLDSHGTLADAHHSSISAGLHIVPASVTIQGTSTKLTNGQIDLGPEVDDSLSAGQVQTLTSGVESNADALHSHAGAGAGAVCYTAYGTNQCAADFVAVLSGTAVFPVGSYSYTGTGGPICAANISNNVTLNYTYWGMGGGNTGHNGSLPCATCCHY